MSVTFEHGGNVFAVARQLGVAPEDILDFSASINPLGPAPGVRDALSAAFARIVHYPETDSPELRQLLADRHGLVPANICVANGSTELIYLLPRLVVGERALVVAPAFSEYGKAMARDRWGVDYFVLRPDDDFRLRLDLLENRLAEGYDLMFFCNPGNPTGRLYSQAELQAVASLCAEAGTFLVLDEAFMDFCEESSAKALAVENPRMLILRSLTKFYALPGLRLGWAIGAPATISRLAALREPWSVNTIAQTAGIASLDDRKFAQKTREQVAYWRKELADGLADLRGVTVFPSSVNYLLLKLPTAKAGEVAAALAEQKILIRNCENFTGLDGRFLRLAVRCGEDNHRLLEALRGVVG